MRGLVGPACGVLLLGVTPDLVWAIRYHDATCPRRGTTRWTRWDEKTPWLPVSLEDELVVEVWDRDLMYGDRLAVIPVAATDLVGAAEKGQLVKETAGLSITMTAEASTAEPAGAGCAPGE